MVSLTSLLVLATFFTQTSASIPRTSYLKLIDAWYVALICENFLVIVSLVVVENLRLQGKPVATKVIPVGEKLPKRPSLSLHEKMNFSLKIIFPIILFIILTAFFSFWSKVQFVIFMKPLIYVSILIETRSNVCSETVQYLSKLIETYMLVYIYTRVCVYAFSMQIDRFI